MITESHIRTRVNVEYHASGLLALPLTNTTVKAIQTRYETDVNDSSAHETTEYLYYAIAKHFTTGKSTKQKKSKGDGWIQMSQLIH
jgi:CO/xanthine dehydrogenase Mo-binding subunit